MSFSAVVSEDEPQLDKLLLSDDPADALDKRVQDHILTSLWPSQKNTDSSVYFQYFQLECETWMHSGIAVAIETYRDFLDLVGHLKSNRYLPRNSPTILDFFAPSDGIDEKFGNESHDLSHQLLQLPLKDRYPRCEPASAEASIFLAVRLWLMLNVGSPSTHTFAPGRTSPEWLPDQSLDAVISSCFPTTDIGPKLSQWPSSLNAYNLERIGGFAITWTDHLADHLYLNEDMDTISMYHHVQVLHGLHHSDSSNEPLPNRLLEETMQTLALLIPRANRDCKRWFRRVYNQGIGGIDNAAGDVEISHWARSPEKYHYWGQRLMILKDAYDASEPKDLGQWWYDRRRKVQWYTFWVAILVLVLTIVFGLIQSVTGIMQVYYTAHPIQQSA